jgi:hypothetical protein
LTDTVNEVGLELGGVTVRIQKKYDAEFRQNAVDMLLTSGKSLKGLYSGSTRSRESQAPTLGLGDSIAEFLGSLDP